MIKPKVDKLVAKHTRQMESFTSLERIFKKKIKCLKSDQKAEGEKGGGL